MLRGSCASRAGGTPVPDCPLAGSRGEEKGSAHRGLAICAIGCRITGSKQFLKTGWLGGRLRAIRVFFRGGSTVEGKTAFPISTPREQGIPKSDDKTAVLPQRLADRCPSCLPYIPPYSLEQAAFLTQATPYPKERG